MPTERLRQRMWANINEAGEIVDLMRVRPHLSGPTGTRTAEVVVYEGDPQSELEAEREAHAAEVAMLRSVMTKARRLIAETFPPYSFPTPPEHEEEARAAHGVLVQIEAALAAPPTAAAQAVEAMREKLDRLIDEIDEVNAQCEGEILGECPALADAYHEASAALAAWKEATRG